jgi:DNA-binding MarR family transcriptional regulator
MKIEPWDVMGRLWHLLQEVNATAAPSLEPFGLVQKDFYVLHAIDTNPNPTPSTIAEVMLIPAATVTDVIKRLASLGYVARKIDIGDLRRHRLDVTPEGKKALKYGAKAIEKQFEKRLGRLTREERATFARLTTRLTDPDPSAE